MRHVELALRPSETLLKGGWITSGNSVVANETCKRIEALTTGLLKHLANDATGWESLFRIPLTDGFGSSTIPKARCMAGGHESSQCYRA